MGNHESLIALVEFIKFKINCQYYPNQLQNPYSAVFGVAEVEAATRIIKFKMSDSKCRPCTFDFTKTVHHMESAILIFGNVIADLFLLGVFSYG